MTTRHHRVLHEVLRASADQHVPGQHAAGFFFGHGRAAVAARVPVQHAPERCGGHGGPDVADRSHCEHVVYVQADVEQLPLVGGVVAAVETRHGAGAALDVLAA